MEKNIVVRGGEGENKRTTMYPVTTFRSANGSWTARMHVAGSDEQLIATGDTEAEAIDNLQAALHERG